MFKATEPLGGGASAGTILCVGPDAPAPVRVLPGVPRGQEAGRGVLQTSHLDAALPPQLLTPWPTPKSHCPGAARGRDPAGEGLPYPYPPGVSFLQGCALSLVGVVDHSPGLPGEVHGHEGALGDTALQGEAGLEHRNCQSTRGAWHEAVLGARGGPGHLSQL